jgi:hypothetical protein
VKVLFPYHLVKEVRMGLIAEALGPMDQRAVLRLGPEIVTTLRKAAAAIRRGEGRTESTTWFGDSSVNWMNRLATNLSRIASVINCEAIRVHGSTIRQKRGDISTTTGRPNTWAAAQRPRGGWGTYTSVAGARGQGMNVRLSIKWNRSPLYRTPANRDSKFQVLVHELSHLLLNTDDGQSGDARREADNWGYFVEEFR